MVKFHISDELKYFTPFTMYMEYILLNYNNFLKKHLNEEKITATDFLYMFNIFCNNGISQKELADLMYVSEANIAKMVKKLDNYGYINKIKDENNKSRNLLSLTQKGNQIVNQFVQLTHQWETNVVKNQDTNMDNFKDLLCGFAENTVDLK